LIGAIGCMGSAPPARYRAELADPATRFEFLDRMVRQYADAGAYAIYWHNLQGVEPGAKMSAPFLLGCPWHKEFLERLAKWASEYPHLHWWFHANHKIPRLKRDGSHLSDISMKDVVPSHEAPHSWEFWDRQVHPVLDALVDEDADRFSVVLDEGGELTTEQFVQTNQAVGVEDHRVIPVGAGGGDEFLDVAGLAAGVALAPAVEDPPLAVLAG